MGFAYSDWRMMFLIRLVMFCLLAIAVSATPAPAVACDAKACGAKMRCPPGCCCCQPGKGSKTSGRYDGKKLEVPCNARCALTVPDKTASRIGTQHLPANFALQRVEFHLAIPAIDCRLAAFEKPVIYCRSTLLSLGCALLT